MRNPAEREIKKEVVLSKCFGCLMEKVIEATIIKGFSEATGMAASSIYYWFEDKDEIFSYTENLYDKCAEKISSFLNAEYSKVRMLVDLFVSTMIDYVIWDEKEKFVNELAFIL